MPCIGGRGDAPACITSALRFSAFADPVLCGVHDVVRTHAGRTGFGVCCMGGFMPGGKWNPPIAVRAEGPMRVLDVDADAVFGCPLRGCGCPPLALVLGSTLAEAESGFAAGCPCASFRAFILEGPPDNDPAFDPLPARSRT